MKRLNHRELALIAKSLLSRNDGFTIDEYGREAKGDLWAVSVQGKEQSFPGRPSLDEVKAYLDRFPIVEVEHGFCLPYFGGCLPYFGGWRDASENVTYLDHSLLWAHKHVAITEAVKANQLAIYNLKTGETFTIPPALFDEPGSRPASVQPSLCGMEDPSADRQVDCENPGCPEYRREPVA
jgi:hypothetical protein